MWWEEYQQLTRYLRDACLSEEYYARIAQAYSRWNTGVEVVIVLFATGSTISGWRLWETESGKFVWAVLASLAALLSVLKPFLGLPRKMKEAGSLRTGYRRIYQELEALYLDLRVTRQIEVKDRERRKSIQDRWYKLELEETLSPNEALARKCAGVVGRRYPPEKLWVAEFGPSEDAEPVGGEHDQGREKTAS